MEPNYNWFQDVLCCLCRSVLVIYSSDFRLLFFDCTMVDFISELRISNYFMESPLPHHTGFISEDNKVITT